MPPIIRFIGRSGSGKTTLVSAVVSLLAVDGVRIAAFKHAHHRVDLDRPGKDSFRLAEAGATAVTVVSPDKVARFEAPPKERGLLDLARSVGDDVDLVLAEGFHGVVTPYFLVRGCEPDARDGACEPGELLGVIGPGIATDGERLFDRDDAPAIAARIRAWLRETAGRGGELERALREAEAFHGHLCPGQLLGVRLALLGCRVAGIVDPKRSKKLITWVEIDRCGADAVQTVTGCRPGKRTLKLVDHGKLAATFLNTDTGDAFRVVARSDSRERAAQLFPQLEKHQAQMAAYQMMDDAELFSVEQVDVSVDPDDLPGKPRNRVQCSACREDVSDNRHIDHPDGPVCRACAGLAYYRPVARPPLEATARW